MVKKDWLGYRTKSELESAVRNELDAKAKGTDGEWVWDREFQSELLSRLFGERHYGCLHHGVRPEVFRVCFNMEYKTSYIMNALIPGIGWRAVSWHNAVDRKTIDDSLEKAFRVVFAKATEQYRRRSQVCEKCGANDLCDVHHVRPTFAAILSLAMSMVTEEDKSYFLDHCFDGDSTNIGANLLDHPAGIIVRDIHLSDGCVMQVLCKACHKATHKTNGEQP